MLMHGTPVLICSPRSEQCMQRAAAHHVAVCEQAAACAEFGRFARASLARCMRSEVAAWRYNCCSCCSFGLQVIDTDVELGRISVLTCEVKRHSARELRRAPASAAN